MLQKKELKCVSVFEPEKSRLGSGREWDDDDSEGGIGLDGEFVEEEVENDAFDVATVSMRSCRFLCSRCRGQTMPVSAQAVPSLPSLHRLTLHLRRPTARRRLFSLMMKPRSGFSRYVKWHLCMCLCLRMCVSTCVSMCVSMCLLSGCATTAPT